MLKNTKITNFENNYLSFPLPYDSLYDNTFEYEVENLDISQFLGDKYCLITNFYILIYRYCYKTNFPITVFGMQKRVQFFVDHNNRIYEEIENEIKNKFNNTDCAKCVIEPQLLITINDESMQWKNENLSAVIILDIKEDNGEMKGAQIIFRKNLFMQITIKRLLDNLNYLSKQTKENPFYESYKYDIVSPSEKKILESFNIKQKDYNIHETYMQYYYEHIKEYGEKTALHQGEIVISFKELNNISNYYADILLKTGSNYIGIYLKDDIATAIAILSILKAGKTIVAINPTYPPERIKHIVNSLNVSTILTCSQTESAINNQRLTNNLIKIDPYIEIEKKLYDVYFPVNVNSICYIIYTSGTTGTPKGIKITQENIMIELNYFKEYFDITPQLRALHILNYSFDFGLYDILSSILYGGCLYSIDKTKMKNFKDYIKYICENEINFINTTPSFFNIIASFHCLLPSLKHIHLGGEKVTYQMIHNYIKVISRDCHIYNGYGPCECTVGSNIYNISEVEKYGKEHKTASVPIGSPTDNSKVYVMDENLFEVPINALGELLIAGESLGIGYVDEKMNDGKFIYVESKENQRMYRTGDLVRWLDSGNIEFIGRIDNQVKINGFRIELSEIDNILTENPCIEEAKTICQESGGSKTLVSFIKTNDKICTQDIKLYLLKYLPFYMVPTKIFRIKEFPYLASGKIDSPKLIIIAEGEQSKCQSEF